MSTYKGLFWTTTTDANSSVFFEKVEILLLELKASDTASQAYLRGELWPAHEKKTTDSLETGDQPNRPDSEDVSV